MLKPEQVPDEVVEAFVDAFHGKDMTRKAAIAAAINAWPGVKLENLCGWVMDGPDLPYVEETASIILPLAEPRDDAV